jgi:farnesyl-diphosphate farnesyltransferase
MNQINDTKQLHNFIYDTLLSRVSRSFYLTLKIVPQAIRDTISLTYLIARIIDTIVDNYQPSYYKKIYFIYLLQHEITDSSNTQQKVAFDNLLQRLHSLLDDKEIIESLPICLKYFSLILQAEKSLAVKVLSTLFRGFKRDADTFTYKTRMVSFQKIADLDNYLYDIAGCVGEFWTDLCFLHNPTYSYLSAAEAKNLAIDFGKALQLVNILRDLPIDLQNNRCYLPAEQFAAYDINLTDLTYTPEKIFPLVIYWRDQAEHYLKSAKKYIENVTSFKQRYALCLPVLIAQKTLVKLNTDLYLRSRLVKKATHFEMKIIMVKAVFFSVFPRLLTMKNCSVG